jgi:large subunit ribosomal protein L19
MVKNRPFLKELTMQDLIQRAVKSTHITKTFPVFRAGDTVEVFVKVKEGEKERVQLYRGIVLKLQGSGVSRSFTVRKISDGVGVERTFPFTSPIIEKIELIANGQVRRSKLYYLRSLEGKAAKVKSERNMEAAIPDTPEVKAAKAAAKEELKAAKAAAPKKAAKPKAAKKA